jgi:hypothetical protein
MKNDKIEKLLDDVIEFLDRMGVPYSINRNPSSEEIERVMVITKRNEDIVKQIQKDYEKRI